MSKNKKQLGDLDSPRTIRYTIWLAMIGICVLVVWSYFARIDQVTRAQGTVIASERTQEVQALDGGILTQLLVAEGSKVSQGQLVAVLEEGRAQAQVSDLESTVAALQISKARLEAEVYGNPLKFDPKLNEYQEFIRNQTNLYEKRTQAIDEDIASINRMLVLAREELKLNQPLLAYGDVSRADIIRLQRQVADLEAQISNKRNKYFQDTQAELTKTQEDLNNNLEKLRERSQILEEKRLYAPTDGLVNNIDINTIGGVVRPGETIIEILPTSSALVVQAKVTPADIAFVKEGQKASVKLDAYDFSIFGAMNGEVVYISPDTIEEDTPEGKKTFYRVLIRIDDAEVQGRGAEIVIRPGMTATVDIKAMDRSVLSYLTKPITKTLSEGMGER